MFVKSLPRLILANCRWLVLLAGVLLWLLIVGRPIMEKYSQSFRFVDEEEHMSVGYLLSQGYRLYRDVTPSHQPLNYIVSAVVHSISHPDNLFMLLKRHREMVFAWSVVCLLLLTYRFHWAVLPLIVGFETTKYFILGNEFLGEAFAIYPLAYLVGVTVEELLTQHTRSEDLWWGIAAVLAIWWVIYLAPLVLVLTGWRVYRHRGKGFTEVLVGIGATLLAGGFWFNWPGYFRQTVIDNYRYQVPALNPVHSFSDWFKLVVFPFQSFRLPGSLLTNWMALMTVILFGSVGYLVLTRKIRWYVLPLVYGILFLANTRQLTPFPYFYQGFHLLPWLGCLFLLAGIVGQAIMARLSSSGKLITGIAAGIPFIWLSGNPGMVYWTKVDPATENYVQYTPLFQSGEVINLLKASGDTLVVMPSNAILHWLTKLPPATRQITFYHWQAAVPEQRRDYDEMLHNRPPTFVVYTNDHSAYTAEAEAWLLKDYTMIFEEKELMGVYMRTNLLSRVSPHLWQAYQSLSSPVLTADQIQSLDKGADDSR